MKKFYTIVLLFNFSAVLLLSQANSNGLNKFPVQLSFFYPIGIHGLNSFEFEYQFSLNILVGRTGGINGFEAGGWVNLNDYYMNGIQAAGIGNICNGPVDGCQFAGVFNVISDECIGFQSAGICNINNGSFQGIQTAGVANINNGYSKAGQLSGIASFSKGIEGVQCSGILSSSNDLVDGVQISGIGNLGKNIKGAQIAGIVNIAENVNGTQVAGIINICDSIDGIPLALFSHVKRNGYRKLEFFTSEYEWGGVTYKTGIRKFYTLFSLGYKGNSEDYNITFGSGIGTSILMSSKKSALDLEWRIKHVTKDFEIKKTQLINTWIIDYSIILLNRIELFAGPSVNLLIASDPLTGIKLAPSWAKAYKHNNRLWAWFGFHAGLRF